MASCVTLLIALSACAGHGDRPSFVRFGADPSRGVLANLTPGLRPFDRPDPTRPSVVFVHGFNPLPKAIHFTMDEQLAQAVGRRTGGAFNVLSWRWGAAAIAGATVKANQEGAVNQGVALASALWYAGVPATRVHLIGQSSGCMVAASAARTLAGWHGRPIAQLTLLDPASFYHDVVFDRLAAGSIAGRVENYWSPGPSGYGRQVAHAGVWNTRVPGPTPLLGAVWPARSSHFYVVDWYIATVGDPSNPGGFNTSLLLAEPPRVEVIGRK